jgi:sulfite exporter TauE/SafE
MIMHTHPLPVSADVTLLFLASFLGSIHCVGMCGPYVALCTARIAPAGCTNGQGLSLRLIFNAGRLVTYMVIGLLAGAFGQIALAFSERAGLRGIIALIAGVVTLLFGLALLGWIRDPSRLMARSGLDVLIRGGSREAFRAPRWASAILLGALQGFLPCALVYAAASRAAFAGSPLGGAWIMLIFGLGTVPAIFAVSSSVSPAFTRFRPWRWSGAFILTVGALLILRGTAALGILPHTIFW